MYLLGIDAAGIQQYVFDTNRLRENAGASNLVAKVTGSEALRLLVELFDEGHNIEYAANLSLRARCSLASEPALRVEVILAGIGSLYVAFREAPDADTFVRTLSERVLVEAPGLDLVFAGDTFDDYSKLPACLDQLMSVGLPRAREEMEGSNPLEALPVEQVCTSTGGPAVAFLRQPGGRPSRPVSASTHARWRAGDDARRMAESFLTPEHRERFSIPDELDDLGRSTGESSYVAVVHVDGDGMGRRLSGLLESAGGAEETMEAVRRFSSIVHQSAAYAMGHTLGQALDVASRSEDVSIPGDGRAVPDLELVRRDGKAMAPVRPIVFGGDDITFICEGRLGIALAVICARAFEASVRELAGPSPGAALENVTASAGVAITKSHYPFYRAYALSVQLLKSAKAYRRELIESGQAEPTSCLDWHLVSGGLGAGLSTLRDRAYRKAGGLLHLRPVSLGENPLHRHRSWPRVERAIARFRGDAWSGRRNKIKGLRSVLGEGRTSVAEFLDSMVASDERLLPDTSPGGTEAEQDYRTTGWITADEDRSAYFDALEIADLYLALDGSVTEDGVRV